MASPAHDQEHSAEYRAFQKHFGDLFECIQNPSTLSARLLSAELLTDATLRDICSSQKQTQQVSDLLIAVKGQIKVNPPSFYKFVEALEKDLPMKDLSDKLRDTCAQLKTETPQVVPPSPPAKRRKSGTAVASYAQFLKDCYRQPLPDDDKLLTTASKHFIELAVISREGVTRRQADEFTRKSLHGQMEEILRKKSPIALEDILKPEKGRAVRCVLVEGAPGVGKSTLAWEVCHKWEELEMVKGYELVVLVRLREKRAQEAHCLRDLLPCHSATNMEELVAAIGRGKGVLLVCDGFDELPCEQRREESVYTELIKGRLLPEATLIVTSRPSVSAGLWWQCQHSIDRHVEVMGFTREKINKYAESIFSGDILQDFLSYITSNPPIYGMMYIPLNAVIVALTYQERYDEEAPFPTTMTQLYDALTRTLIRRHLVSTKQVPPDFRMPRLLLCKEEISMLPPQVAQQLHELARVACEGVCKDRYVFTNLGEDFGHLGMMKKTTSLDPSVGPECSFNFLHLTLQEYLSALHIAIEPPNDLPMLSQLYSREIVMRFLVGLCNHDRHSHHLYLEVLQKLSSMFVIHSGVTFKRVLCPLVLWCAYECPSIMQDIEQVKDYLMEEVVQVQLSSLQVPFDHYIVGYCINHFGGRWRVEIDEPQQVDLLIKGLQSSPVVLGRIWELMIGPHGIFDLNFPTGRLSALLQVIPSLMQVHNVHILEFSRVYFSECDITLLQQLISPGGGLRCLVVDNCHDKEQIFPLVFGPSSLELLTVSDVFFFPKEALKQQIVHLLSQNANLKKLVIVPSLLNPVAAALQNNTSLTHLTIQGGLPGIGLRYILAPPLIDLLKSNQTLHELHLYGEVITAEDLQLLFPFCPMPELHYRELMDEDFQMPFQVYPVLPHCQEVLHHPVLPPHPVLQVVETASQSLQKLTLDQDDYHKLPHHLQQQYQPISTRTLHFPSHTYVTIQF